MPSFPLPARVGRGSSARNNKPATVWILVFPNFQLLDATGPAQVFSTANDDAMDAGLSAPYRIRLISPTGGPVVSTAGATMLTERLPAVRRLGGGTLVVSGGKGIEQAAEEKSLLRWLAGAQAALGRCCSVCSGAFLLARAGLLDGRRAVTHWMDVDLLRRQYPAVQVHDDAIFIKDGTIYTSAGITAGIDLCLSLVQEDLGRAAALSAAKRLVVYHKRAGGQRQFSATLMAQLNEGGVADRLTNWLKPHLHRRIDVDAMATAMAMSNRSLHRRLRQEIHVSPSTLLARLRVEAACRMLEADSHSVKQVARKSGFGSEYNLRRAFAAHLGVLPSEYRTRFG
ncbi:MAG: GlxA family transcriptional regulator [Burkholderiales bacterium]